MKIIISVLLILISSSCTSHIKIKQTFKSKDVDSSTFRKASYTVYGTTNISLTDFTKTYDEDFKNDEAFNEKMTSFLESKLRLKFKNNVQLGSGDLPDYLRGEDSFANNKREDVPAFLDKQNSDYLIFLKMVTIGSEYTSTTNYNANTGMSTTNTSEDCIVTLFAEMWDVKAKRKVLEFESIGRSTVFLFAFSTALESSMKNAADNMAKYLYSGGKYK